jgi:hypothetical protein
MMNDPAAWEKHFNELIRKDPVTNEYVHEWPCWNSDLNESDFEDPPEFISFEETPLDYNPFDAKAWGLLRTVAPYTPSFPHRNKCSNPPCTISFQGSLVSPVSHTREAQGSVETSTLLSLNRQTESAHLYDCTSIYIQGMSCSELGRVLVLNDPPSRLSSSNWSKRRRATH